MTRSDYLSQLFQRLHTFRQEAQLEPEQVESNLVLGPGWIHAFESGAAPPGLDVVMSLLSLYGKTLRDLAEGIEGNAPSIKRSITPEKVDNDLVLHFPYGKYDATYRLEGATVEQFTEIVLTLRNGLAQLADSGIGKQRAETIKMKSVANAFMKAVELWPQANPSDLWWFLVYRAYCDPYNHPAQYARLDFAQSWKRTAGWALELVLEKHYGDTLAEQGINMVRKDSERKARILHGIDVGHRLEPDKVDIMLTVGEGVNERMIGVVHVKASFAERRTDDVPMSQALVDASYISPLWTMDCKSFPSPEPVNRGELGKIFTGEDRDQRNAKRKDIESDGLFSACFSYNRNTRPTPPDTPLAKARIYSCDFTDPDDAFTRFVVSESRRFRK